MIENIFRIIKADRYTKDGCDEIQKAKDNLAEDEKYNIGDISKKTGLQKTSNGWVKPKSGKKPSETKTGPGTTGQKIQEGQSYIEANARMTQAALEALNRGDISKEQFKQHVQAINNATRENLKKINGAEPNVHGAEVDKIYERQLKRIKELKAKGFTDEQIDNDKIIKQTKEDMKNVGKQTGAKNAERKPTSLAGTPMKKADLNSKDPYEITYSMKPDTASEAKEMDKISAFMQEETGATLRNAITARESFYKNTKNPTPEQQKGLAALMKIQQKLGYGKPAEGPALNGQKKTVSYQEYRDGPMYGPAESKPAAGSKPDKVGDFMKAYERGDFGKYQQNAEQKKVESFFSNKDSAPRVLTGDCKIRIRK